jgi:hypothetical protein
MAAGAQVRTEIDPFVRNGAAIFFFAFLFATCAFVTVVVESFLPGLRAQIRVFESIFAVAALSFVAIFCAYSFLMVTARLFAALRDEVKRVFGTR